MKNYVFLLVLIIGGCHLVLAQDAKWVIAAGRSVAGNVTPDEGKQRALDIARGEAIKEVVGVRVQEELFP